MNAGPGSGRQSPWPLFAVALAVLALGGISSLSIGAAKHIGVGKVVQSIIAYDGSLDHLIVRDVRLPRAVLAAIVGANLAVAGTLMQGITGNPLASPSLLGVNSGAAFAFVAAVILWPVSGTAAHIAAAFAGAAVAGGLVLYLGSPTGMANDTVRLVLAGIALTALLSSITNGLIILDDNSTEQVVYWLVGGVDGRDWADVALVAPWSLVGLLGSVFLAKSLDVMAFGDEMARGLGANTLHARIAAAAVVIALAGTSVAVAGPIGFIGLIVPHIARPFVGVRHLVLLPSAAVLGGAALLLADVASRFIAYPFESPAGIVTALVGAPFFLYLARSNKGAV